MKCMFFPVTCCGMCPFTAEVELPENGNEFVMVSLCTPILPAPSAALQTHHFRRSFVDDMFHRITRSQKNWRFFGCFAASPIPCCMGCGYGPCAQNVGHTREAGKDEYHGKLRIVHASQQNGFNGNIKSFQLSNDLAHIKTAGEGIVKRAL